MKKTLSVIIIATMFIGTAFAADPGSMITFNVKNESSVQNIGLPNFIIANLLELTQKCEGNSCTFVVPSGVKETTIPKRGRVGIIIEGMKGGLEDYNICQIDVAANILPNDFIHPYTSGYYLSIPGPDVSDAVRVTSLNKKMVCWAEASDEHTVNIVIQNLVA